MSRWPPRRRAARITAVVVLVAAAVGPVGTAFAHPGGEVPRARLSVDGQEVHIDWIAAPDDAAEVLVAAGVWPEDVAGAYLDVAFGAPADLLPSAQDIRAASRHPALPAYLTDNVRLEQDGQPCPGTVHPPQDLLVDGVRVTFRCPTRPGRVLLTVSLLHERDPAYRTFSLDGTRRVAIHTADDPTHAWDLGRHAPVTSTASVLLGAAIGVAGLAALGLRRLWRTP
ncbi:MAG: hypothetical protein ACNA8R_14400 [Nitriliruptoraceae bacterium]